MADCKACTLEAALLALKQRPNTEHLVEVLAEIQVEPGNSMAQCGRAEILQTNLCSKHAGSQIVVFPLIDSAELFRNIDGSVQFMLVNNKYSTYKAGEIELPWEWPVRLHRDIVFFRLRSGNILVFGSGPRSLTFLYLPADASRFVNRTPMNLNVAGDIYKIDPNLTCWRDDQTGRSLDELLGDSLVLAYLPEQRALVQPESNQ